MFSKFSSFRNDERVSQIEWPRLTSSKPEQFLAGNVELIIRELGVVTVKSAASTGTLLDLGTLLFMKSQIADFVILGKIMDVFGSVGEPMYEIKILDNKNFVEAGIPVYYFNDHPDTRVFSLQRNENKQFRVVEQK